MNRFINGLFDDVHYVAVPQRKLYIGTSLKKSLQLTLPPQFDIMGVTIYIVYIQYVILFLKI